MATTFRNMSLIFLGLLFAAVFLPALTSGSGTISFKLTHYKNRDGYSMDGECCDGVKAATSCDPAICDPYFVVSIYENGRHPVVNLTYTTGSTKDSADISFDSMALIGQAPNPIVSRYSTWPGAVVVTVDVYDDNSDLAGVPDLLLANLSAIVTQYPLDAHNTTLYPIDIAPVNGISLEALANIRCDRDYYGIYCYKHCRAADNTTDHYTCDDQGDRQCRPGWSGDTQAGCPTPVTVGCTPGLCQNGATCYTPQQTPQCFCPPDYTGIRCETQLTKTTPATTTVATPVSTASTFRSTATPRTTASYTRTTPTAASSSRPSWTRGTSSHAGSPVGLGQTSSTPPVSMGTSDGTPGVRESQGSGGGGGVNGAAIGGAIGGLLLLALLVLLLAFLIRRNKQRRVALSEDAEQPDVTSQEKITPEDTNEEKTTPEEKSDKPSEPAAAQELTAVD